MPARFQTCISAPRAYTCVMTCQMEEVPCAHIRACRAAEMPRDCVISCLEGFARRVQCISFEPAIRSPDDSQHAAARRPLHPLLISAATLEKAFPSLVSRSPSRSSGPREWNTIPHILRYF